MKIFSERLKYERKQKGLSQLQIAQLLNIPQSTYMHYELIGTPNGREPSMEIILQLSIILDVSIDYLFGKQDY